MRSSVRRLVIAIVALLILFGWLAWPWLKTIPDKLQPLRDYVVYDADKPAHTGRQPTVWRQPVSRTELLLAREYHNQRPRRPKRPPTQSTLQAINILPDDQLDDFVVEHPKYFARPRTWQELNAANYLGKAQRAASFFSSTYPREKPFFGRIPTSSCYQNGRGLSMPGHLGQLRIQKDGAWVDTHLPTPEKPEVFVVAAQTAEGAQLAAYERRPPVSYPYERYWAVIYVGSSSSTPHAFLIDRVAIDKTFTDVLLCEPTPGSETRDIVPYWFFVPLGRLPDGQYHVHVRHASGSRPSFSTTADLRRATEKEIEIQQRTQTNESANWPRQGLRNAAGTPSCRPRLITTHLLTTHSATSVPLAPTGAQECSRQRQLPVPVAPVIQKAPEGA